MKKLAMTLCLLAVSSSAALAGSLKTTQVAGDAKLVIHLDLAAALQSEIGKFILNEAEKRQDFLDMIDNLRNWFGFDPIQDLRGITFYAKTYEKDRGVVVVDATVDQDKVLGALAQNPAYRAIKYGDYTLYRWQDEAKNDKPAKMQYGCFYDKTTIVVAQTEDLVKGAIDVLAGKTPNLAKTAALKLLPKQVAGGFIIGAASDLKLPADPNKPQTAILKSVTGVGLQAGEAEKTIFVDAIASTTSPEEAQKLCQVVQGFVALGQMMLQQRQQEGDVPQLGEKVTVLAEGSVATLSASAPTESVIKMVKFLADRAGRMRQRQSAPAQP